MGEAIPLHLRLRLRLRLRLPLFNHKWHEVTNFVFKDYLLKFFKTYRHTQCKHVLGRLYTGLSSLDILLNACTVRVVQARIMQHLEW